MRVYLHFILDFFHYYENEINEITEICKFKFERALIFVYQNINTKALKGVRVAIGDVRVYKPQPSS